MSGQRSHIQLTNVLTASTLYQSLSNRRLWHLVLLQGNYIWLGKEQERTDGRVRREERAGREDSNLKNKRKARGQGLYSKRPSKGVRMVMGHGPQPWNLTVWMQGSATSLL